MDFFDTAFTFSERSSNVTCCKPDNTFKEATCGQGVSCAGQCSALGASLCPSGNCTDDPETCDVVFESAKGRKSGRSTDTFSGSDLDWCTNAKHQCRVRKHKDCCYNSKCLKWKGRKEACAWLNYLTGEKNGSKKRFKKTFQARHAPSLAACPMEVGPVRCRRFQSRAPPSWMKMHSPTPVSTDTPSRYLDSMFND